MHILATNEEPIGPQLDITGPCKVEVQIREDGTVLWVNVEGVCRLRICRVEELLMEDGRQTPIEDVMIDSGMTGHPPTDKYKRLSVEEQVEEEVHLYTYDM